VLAALRCVVLVGTLALAACKALPEIRPDVCGNGVIEPGEDCDGFASGGLACHPPGENGQCHLDCSPGPGGKAPACPAGYGCDLDNACRRATGAFTSLPQRIFGNAGSLISGDFDDDGRFDVVSQVPEVHGTTKIRAHYFDRSAAPTRSWTSNDPLSAPALLGSSRNGRQSLATARFGGVSLLTGEADGSLIAEALPSYFLEGTEGRVFTVSDGPVHDSASIVVMAKRDGKFGLYREGRQVRVVELAVELSFGVEALAAEPVVATLFEDDANPCRDVVLAEGGSQEINVYSLCEHDRQSGEVMWRELPGIARLPLPGTVHLTHGLLAADLDGDGHLDLMAGTDAGNHVAYGDGASFTRFVLAPAIVEGERAREVMPLAAGDLSGDGHADFVLPDALYVSDPGSPARSPTYRPNLQQVTTKWSEAAIADFNRDGLLDAVAISGEALDISFMLGTGSERSNLFTIPTTRPIDHLAIGDFDGDLINDVAVVQRPSVAGSEAEVAIAYGNPSGAPGAPRAAARVPDVRQILSFRTTPGSDVSFLGILYRQRDARGVDGSALALLPGNTDRNLPCVVELTSFNKDGSLGGGAAASVAAGAFTTPGVSDVLALALAVAERPNSAPRPDPVPVFQLWLLRDIASRRGDPALLGGSLPADLQPLVGEPPLWEVRSTMASGDLDGDGLDEVVLAGSDTTGERCLLFVMRIDTNSGLRVDPTAPIVLDHPCAEGTQMSVSDLDGDGARDVVLLLGADGSGRKLLAFWGDGAGQFHPNAFVSLAPEDQQPNAFTLLEGESPEGISVVYTTPDAVRTLRPRATERRSFDDAGVLVELGRGSGIVAADVDGDGVKDLAVADDGAVRILRAELESQ
jgi:hypothetical protein